MSSNKDLFDNRTAGRDDNRDPLSGTPGAHPVGAGAGAAAGGAAAGAAAGAVGGPVGAAVGAVAGGVAGGLVGKAIAEKVNPTAEDAYWREEFTKRPYAGTGATYEDYAPAYRHGWESYDHYGRAGRSFTEVEPELRRDWESRKGKSALAWDRAKEAARDAWARVESKIPGRGTAD